MLAIAIPVIVHREGTTNVIVDIVNPIEIPISNLIEVDTRMDLGIRDIETVTDRIPTIITVPIIVAITAAIKQGDSAFTCSGSVEPGQVIFSAESGTYKRISILDCSLNVNYDTVSNSGISNAFGVLYDDRVQTNQFDDNPAVLLC